MSLLRYVGSLVFIFLCTTAAWIILGSTIWYRTDNSDHRLKDSVGSTWGTSQEQEPLTAGYTTVEMSQTTTEENGRTIIHNNKIEHQWSLVPIASRIQVNLNLDYRQKGLLWYSTYVVNFAADYTFRNPTADAQQMTFRLPLPAQKAVYDGLAMTFNGRPLTINANEQNVSGGALVAANEVATVHIVYKSQGLSSWRYKLAEGIAQIHDFALTMRTNFKDIDFADDTLSPTAKQAAASGWDLEWRYANLVSGFQIGMTMPEHLQPGPLAGQISYFAPVSLFFFFFLIFIVSTMRGINLHPMNYFFLAAAFFAFHLLLAYLVDHVSIHTAMAISSVASMALVVSYLRLVVGIRFALLEAGVAQLIYLVIFSYAFFWKGFTGLSITVIAVITLFAVMQATGRIRWSEKFKSRPV